MENLFFSAVLPVKYSTFVNEHQREFPFGYCYKITYFDIILIFTYNWTYYFHITY